MNATGHSTPLAWQRRGGRMALVLALGAVGLAVLVAVRARRPPAPSFTISAGSEGTTRSAVATALVHELGHRGAQVTLVSNDDGDSELAAVDDGHTDFALVPGAYHLRPCEHVREVGALYLEALHLAVRGDLADAVGRDLGAIEGHSIDLGPPSSGTEGLARMLLTFAGIHNTGGGMVTTNLSYDELDARAEGRGGPMPDVVFHLGIVPSQVIQPLVRDHGYRLVSLPFADAMRLNALTAGGVGHWHDVDWQYVTAATIPAFTYSSRPAVPTTPLETVGSRLLLVANADVPAATVELLLEAVFHSRFARIADPPLDPSVLKLPPRLPRHPGTVAYMRRNDPLITADSVDTMSNMLSILGALVGGAIFFFQWNRQRTASRRDEVFGSYVARAADIERHLAALELRATLDLPELIALQRQVLELKAEALERFAAGELSSQASLSQLLAPLNATREHIGDLLLHVREDLTERAAAEGRSEQAVWHEAARPAAEPEAPPRASS